MMIRKTGWIWMVFLTTLLLTTWVSAQTEPAALDKARQALGERRYDRCLEILATAPDVPERHRIEGEVRYFKGEIPEAIRALEHYLSRAGDVPEAPRARYRLAACLARLGRFAEAVKLTRQGLTHVANPKRRCELARLLMERGQRAAYPEKTGEKPDLGQALAFFQEARPFAAEDPDLAGELQFAMARVRGLLTQRLAAARLLAALLEEPLPPSMLASSKQNRSGSVSGVEVDVDRPLVAPRLRDEALRDEAARRLGDQLLALKQPGRAREVYRATFVRRPEGPQAPACLIGMARSHGFPRPTYRHALEQGAEALERLVKSFPEHARAPEALTLLAEAYRNFKRPEAALKTLTQLVNHYASSKQAVPAARDIARLHRGQKAYRQALKAYDQALAAFPTHPLWSEIRRERIDCEYEQATDARTRGDRENAARLFDTFLEHHPLDPRAPQVLLALAQMAEKSNRLPDAIRHYTALASKYPGTSARAALLARAALEEKAGDFTTARATLKSIPGNGGAARLRAMEEKTLSLETRHVDDASSLHLATRNLEQVELRLYRISAVDYFERHLGLQDVARLDVPLIRPDHVWTVKVARYTGFKEFEQAVKLPGVGEGAFVVSAVADDLRATTLIVVSPLRLVARMTGDRVDVVLGQGPSFTPVAGAEVRVAGAERVVLRGVTDKEGRFTGKIADHLRPVGQAGVLASHGEAVAWARVAVPVRTAGRKGAGVVLWTDRARYRGGETLRFWAVVGDDDRAARDVEVVGPENVRIRRFHLTPDSGGVFAGALLVPGFVREGDWTVRVLTGNKVVATRIVKVAPAPERLLRVAVRSESNRVYLGKNALFVVTAADRFEHPAAYETFTYRVTGDPETRSFTTDEHGRARVELPSDRFGLADSMSLDVYHDNQWIAGCTVPVVWDGFRATVEPMSDTFLQGESVEAVVSATTFDGIRQARDLTVVVRRVREHSQTEEVCRVPVRTATQGADVKIQLPIPGEGAFSLLLEGDEGMVPTGSALFISGPDDPRKIRILGRRDAVRPGTTAVLRVHCREDQVAAVLVAANHREQRIQRVPLNRGVTEIPVPIREQDLPWLRVRIGAAMGDAFYTDEVTLPVEDPLDVTVTATPPDGPPEQPVTLRLAVRDGDGRPVRGSAVLLLVPESVEVLYRGFFQGVAEAFLGDTKAADSALASSYPFTYGGGHEQVAILAERDARQPGFFSNWASVVDRNALVTGVSSNDALGYAQVFEQSVHDNFFRGAGQQQQEDVSNRIAQQAAVQTLTTNRGFQARARSSNFVNPMLLNQGSGQVFLARNEVSHVLAASNRGGFSGLFQDLDSSRNRWNVASVVVCSDGSVARVPEDLETRRRRLAEQVLAHAANLAAPQLFLVETTEDGRAEVTLARPDGPWRVMVLVSGHEHRRFGEAACTTEGRWPFDARVIVPHHPQTGDEARIDLRLYSVRDRRVRVMLEMDGQPTREQTVAFGAERFTNVSFPWKVPAGSTAWAGRFQVEGRTLPFRVEVSPDAVPEPTMFVRRPAPAGTPGAPGGQAAITCIRKLLDTPDGVLSEAAWLLARLVESRAARQDITHDVELETRLAGLMQSGSSDGGWPFCSGETRSNPTASVLVAWVIEAAEKVGLAAPDGIRSKLVAYLKNAFSRAHEEADKTLLLLGLSRLEAVDFAYANRLFRAREKLSSRDLAIVLLLLRRQGDTSPMVKTVADLLRARFTDNGSVAGTGVAAPFCDGRTTTALAALALFGLDESAVKRALTALDSQPVCPARDATGLALEAVARAAAATGDARRWVVEEVASPAPGASVDVFRSVHYAPLRYRGHTIHRGYNLVENYRSKSDSTRRVGEGKRFRVDLTLRTRGSLAHAILVETLPAGAWLVPGSVNRGAMARIQEGQIRFHVEASTPANLKERRFHLSYELEGAIAGHYGFGRPLLIVAGGTPVTVSDRSTRDLTIVGPGEDDRKGYDLTPLEHSELGRIHWALGEYDRAYPHLDTLMKKWRLRQDAFVETAALLLDMDVRARNARGMVEHFEVLKEGSPERSVPFRKILPVADAYAELGEHERALQVQRGALDGFFQVDFGLGNALLTAGDRDAFCGFVEPLLRLYPANEATRDGRYYVGQKLLERAGRGGDEKKAARVKYLAAAAAAFRQALEEGGGAAGTEASAFALAGTLLEQEHYGEAAALCTRAGELYADSHLKDGFEYVEAYSLFEESRYDAAEKMARRLASGQYRDASGRLRPSENRYLALHMLAKIHHARGDIAAAVEAYRKVKTLFPDAARALAYFEWRVLQVPELTELSVNENRTIRLAYKNVDSVQIRAYRVDLMTLYLRERSLNRITRINLAGIKPFYTGTFPVRASTYRMDEVPLVLGRKAKQRSGPADPIPVVLPDAGAYLLVVRSGETESMGMVLRTDLRMDIQTDPAGGTLRATVYDRTSGSFVSRVDVKFVGSQDRTFATARTDLRGVAEASGLSGYPTVIARQGDQYAFYRSQEAVGRPARNKQRQQELRRDGRLDNVRKQLDALFKSNVERVEEGQRGRGGVQIKKVK